MDYVGKMGERCAECLQVTLQVAGGSVLVRTWLATHCVFEMAGAITALSCERTAMRAHRHFRAARCKALRVAYVPGPLGPTATFASSHQASLSSD
jgi:hypothetical protein